MAQQDAGRGANQGDDAVDWRAELKRRAAEVGQRKLANLIGYSASTINQVIAGTYKGDVSAVRRAVEGALMREHVACPALGQDIGANDCLKFQRMPLAATHPARARLHRTCPTCPHNRQSGRADAAA